MIGLHSCCCGSSVYFYFNTAYFPSYGDVGLLLRGSGFESVVFPAFEYSYSQSTEKFSQHISFSLDYNDKASFFLEFKNKYELFVKDKPFHQTTITYPPPLYQNVSIVSDASHVFDLVMNSLNSLDSGFCCA